MRKLALVLCLLVWPAAAQTTMKTLPSARVSVPITGSITTGNTFQSILAADSNRTACAIQNTSADTMYFYVGPTASASKAASIQVATNGVFYCSNQGGTIVATDNIAVTTTTTSDTFAGFYQD